MSEDALFSAAEARIVRPLPSLLPACGRCGLAESGCHSPKMPVDGSGRRQVLIVSDYPGKEEDRDGRPMVGRAGQLLQNELRRIDVDLRRDCWTMNALSCYNAGDTEPKTVVTDCRPLVLRAIRELDPLVILLMGSQAVKSVIGHLWKEKTGLVSRWAGWHIPAHKPNAWVCPTYNPAALLYDDCDPVTKLEFQSHLEAAFILSDRPWKNGPPDYQKRVEVIMEPDRAAARLVRYTSGVVAYDFETNCSKPDGPKSEIVCCSVCWEGRETIAFPWHGAVKSAMKRLLTNSNVHKIASNLDMEDRWTRKHLGIEVVGWWHDTMLTAHLLDPRGDEDRKSNDGISGLKFQSFVRLGQPAYNEHIETFLVPDKRGGYELNRVKEVKPQLMLKYCAMDSLLEYEVAMHQRVEMGLE